MDKTKYICGFCNKGFTRNASLRRHKQNLHFNTKHKCISCAKVYTRLEDLHKHAKECLRIKLEDKPQETTNLTSEVPSTSTDTATLASDLALSDSNTSIDSVTGLMGQQLESILNNKPLQPLMRQIILTVEIQ